ncbi:hypothetical protein ACFQY7_39515 [Actinomadura luteofluorescens]|uniref:hypothetical protein n=1 Tax=Actinomadura luteofluorescens TaxID=46163 RepID=UPI003634A8B0
MGPPVGFGTPGMPGAAPKPGVREKLGELGKAGQGLGAKVTAKFRGGGVRAANRTGGPGGPAAPAALGAPAGPAVREVPAGLDGTFRPARRGSSATCGPARPDGGASSRPGRWWAVSAGSDSRRSSR